MSHSDRYKNRMNFCLVRLTPTRYAAFAGTSSKAETGFHVAAYICSGKRGLAGRISREQVNKLIVSLDACIWSTEALGFGRHH
jgi:hypothetical protein